MLYQIVKPLARWILGLNFKKIYLTGIEQLPADGPVIIAANHPTAFIEPCVLASFQKRPLHFLVRGDFFRKKIFSYLLRVLHMIPIYRMKDGGYKNIKNNFSSFERCFEALKEGKVLMILAEGFCVHEKRLRPIRKGTARIAFGAYEKTGITNIPIVPVGVNYTNSDAYRSDLMIHFGKPLSLSDYIEDYEIDKPEGIRKLTQAIEDALKKGVIHINNKENDQAVEQLFSVWRSEYINDSEDFVRNDESRIVAELHLAKTFSELEDPKKSAIQELLQSYKTELKQAGLKKDNFSNVPPKFAGLFTIIGFPIFLLSVVFFFIPLAVAHLVGSLPGISIEFRHPVRVATAMGILVIWISTWCFHFGWQQNILAFIVLISPIFLWLSIRYREWTLHYLSFVKGKRLSKAQKDQIANLRKQILSYF